MQELHFLIFGNPDDPRGHPVPKAKLTGGQQWSAKARRYVEWKEHVVAAYIAGLNDKTLEGMAAIYLARCNKPIGDYGEKAYMSVVAHYHNHKHPDTENVFGSIADALFHNDSKLAGTFDFDVGHPEKAGTVDVILSFPFGAKPPNPSQEKPEARRRPKSYGTR